LAIGPFLLIASVISLFSHFLSKARFLLLLESLLFGILEEYLTEEGQALARLSAADEIYFHTPARSLLNDFSLFRLL